MTPPTIPPLPPPVPILPDPGTLPADLVTRPQWVGWRWEERDGKPTKVPINPRTGRRAKADTPTTWGTFAEACARARADGLAGVGYIFAYDDPYCGWDVDHCRDPETGQLDERGRRVVAALDTYAEVSPSGAGVKLIARARLPLPAPAPGQPNTGKRNTREQIEAYHHRRLFTVTGRHLEDTPATIEDRQPAVDRLFAEFFGPARPERPAAPPRPAAAVSHDDQAVLDAIRAGRNGPKFDRVWHGDLSDYAGDESSAEQFLCNELAYYGCDAGQIERLWLASSVGQRDKTRTRADYRSNTIDKALRRPQRYEWHQPPAPEPIPADRAPADMPPAADAPDADQAAYWRERARRAEAESASKDRALVERDATIAAQAEEIRQLKETVRLQHDIMCRSDLKDLGPELVELAHQVASTPPERRAELGGVRVVLEDSEVTDKQTGERKPVPGYGSRLTRDPDTIGRHFKLAPKVIPCLKRKRRWVTNEDGERRPAVVYDWERPDLNGMLHDILTIPIDLPKGKEKPGKPKRVQAPAARVCPDCGSEDLQPQEAKIIVREPAICGNCQTVVTLGETPVPFVTPVNLPGAGLLTTPPPRGSTVVNPLPGDGLPVGRLLTAGDLLAPHRLHKLRTAEAAIPEFRDRAHCQVPTCSEFAADGSAYCAGHTAWGWGQAEASAPAPEPAPVAEPPPVVPPATNGHRCACGHLAIIGLGYCWRCSPAVQGTDPASPAPPGDTP